MNDQRNLVQWEYAPLMDDWILYCFLIFISKFNTNTVGPPGIHNIIIIIIIKSERHDNVIV